jgi:hypothetical protein
MGYNYSYQMEEVGLSGHVAGMGEKGNAYRVFGG